MGYSREKPDWIVFFTCCWKMGGEADMGIPKPCGRLEDPLQARSTPAVSCHDKVAGVKLAAARINPAAYAYSGLLLLVMALHFEGHLATLFGRSAVIRFEAVLEGSRNGLADQFLVLHGG